MLSPFPVVTPRSFRTRSSPTGQALLLAGREHEAVLYRTPGAQAGRGRRAALTPERRGPCPGSGSGSSGAGARPDGGGWRETVGAGSALRRGSLGARAAGWD